MFRKKQSPQKARDSTKSQKQKLKHFGRNEAFKRQGAPHSVKQENQRISQCSRIHRTKNRAPKQIEKHNVEPTTLTRIPKVSSLIVLIRNSQHIEYMPTSNLHPSKQLSIRRRRGNLLEGGAQTHTGKTQVTK
jgi:hypothetical protein